MIVDDRVGSFRGPSQDGTRKVGSLLSWGVGIDCA